MTLLLKFWLTKHFFALEEVLISMLRSSRVITFRFDGRTQQQMFLFLYDRHVGAHVRAHANMASPYKVL